MTSSAFAVLVAVAACSKVGRQEPAAATAKEPSAPEPVREGIHGVEPGARVRGWLSFETTTRVPNVGSVQYLLNGRPLSGPLATAPYAYPWYTGSVFDGPDVLVAAILDRQGKELARTDPVPFQIANGDATITLVSPDPSKPLAGTVDWTVSAARAMTQEELTARTAKRMDPKPYEAMVFAVDGVLTSVKYGSKLAVAPGPATATQTLALDTTRFPNGTHELLVSAYATSLDLSLPATGMLQHAVTFDNGHALMDVRSDWRDIFLAPGRSQGVTPRALYTDGQSGPVTGTLKLETADPHVAVVADSGLVTAVAPGVTSVTLTAMGRTSSVRVIVDVPRGLPHFSRDGHVLTTYDPSRSIFVRTMFMLNGAAPGGDRELDFQLHEAGINTLTSNAYFNPADGGSKDLASWRKGFDYLFGRQLDSAREHGYQLLLTGDDICRTAKELNDSLTNPWAREAIQYAFLKAKESGRVVGVEMIDEASFWGPSPRPAKGAFSKFQPPIPDDPFTKLVGIIRGVAGGPPISWPVLGIAPVQVAHDWMGDPAFSDYASHYWDVLDWRRVYPRGVASKSQLIRAMSAAVVGRYPVMQRDRPALLVEALSGPFNSKRGPGG